MFKKHSLAIGIAGIALLSLIGAGIAYANPSYFGPGVSTNNAASTSVAYLIPGAATSTTPVLDAYTPSGQSTKFKVNQASVAIQFTASTTNSILTATIEYSNDNVDWYRSYVVDSNGMGTSTNPFYVTTPDQLSWKFASSSVGGVGIGATSNMSTAYIIIPTPARYTRIVFSIAGANGAVWAYITPIKEQY